MKIDEALYDYDFDEDGKKSEIYLDEVDLDYWLAPGRPWWGEAINPTSPESVTLNEAKHYISRHWEQTGVYGEVTQVEFYVTTSEAKVILEWWQNRYKHLGAYSVKPWKGEQCTTTVIKAIAEGMKLRKHKSVINYIDDKTYTPKGYLNQLKDFRSTSKHHKNEKVVVTIIKEESKDYKE